MRGSKGVPYRSKHVVAMLLTATLALAAGLAATGARGDTDQPPRDTTPTDPPQTLDVPEPHVDSGVASSPDRVRQEWEYMRGKARGGGVLRDWPPEAVAVEPNASQTQPAADEPPVDEPAEVFKSGAIVTIDTDISDVTRDSIERRVQAAIDRGAKIIVFELDTPGGMVTSALDICDYIKNLKGVKTVAWIHPQAYSAGSMIATACNEIVMAPRSTIGDCGVILGGPTGPSEVPEELRAKAEAPVLEQFRDSAARNGYDTLLCEAMVVKEHVVYWIENKVTGERRFVDDKDYARLVGTDDQAGPFKPIEDTGKDKTTEYEWKPVESYPNPVTGDQTKIRQPVVGDNELLTMSQSQAMAFGFCKAIVADSAELAGHYNMTGQWQRLHFNWSERFTGWLTSMPVRMFLLVIILLGAYVEFHTPGVGVPGLVALICLAIFVGAPYLTGLANVWEIVLILLGFVLLAIEVFVIPGFGITGIGGIVLIIVGLLATFIPEEPGRELPIYWPHLDQGVHGLKIGLITIGTAIVGSIAGMAVISRFLPRISWLRGVFPENPLIDAVAVEDPYRGHAQVGDRGVATSPLRPAGKARFNNVYVDVVTEGDLVDQGAEVEVIERRGNRVVVRQVT